MIKILHKSYKEMYSTPVSSYPGYPNTALLPVDLLYCYERRWSNAPLHGPNYLHLGCLSDCRLQKQVWGISILHHFWTPHHQSISACIKILLMQQNESSSISWVPWVITPSFLGAQEKMTLLWEGLQISSSLQGVLVLSPAGPFRDGCWTCGAALYRQSDCSPNAFIKNFYCFACMLLRPLFFIFSQLYCRLLQQEQQRARFKLISFF